MLRKVAWMGRLQLAVKTSELHGFCGAKTSEVHVPRAAHLRRKKSTLVVGSKSSPASVIYLQ